MVPSRAPVKRTLFRCLELGVSGSFEAFFKSKVPVRVPMEGLGVQALGFHFGLLKGSFKGLSLEVHFQGKADYDPGCHGFLGTRAI